MTEPIHRTNLDELKRLAEATAGTRWWTDSTLMTYGFCPADASFIAACTPATILALLRVVEASERAVVDYDIDEIHALSTAIAALKEAK